MFRMWLCFIGFLFIQSVQAADDVIETNIEKLESRYPGGFDAYLSENRKDGDI